MSKPVDNADLPSEVIEAFTSSAVTTLQELTQLVAIPIDGSANKSATTDDTVVAVVRLKRSVPGSLTLVLPPESARRLAEAYLPSGAELTDEIINDVAGELANVIAGQAKAILKGTPYHFRLSIPVVSRHRTRVQTPGVAVALALKTSQLLLIVDLCACPGA